MLFAKIKEKLLNRRNDIEISEIKDSKGNIIDLEELINNPVIKTGTYILDENYVFKWIEDIPDDYSGYVLSIGDDGFMYIETYDNGVVTFSTEIASSGISVSDLNNHKGANLTTDGIDKINATSGTPVTVYGEDAEGNLVKGAVSGGTKLYKHTITDTNDESIIIIDTNSNTIDTSLWTAVSDLLNYLLNHSIIKITDDVQRTYLIGQSEIYISDLGNQGVSWIEFDYFQFGNCEDEVVAL